MNTWSSANHCRYPDEYAAENPTDEDSASAGNASSGYRHGVVIGVSEGRNGSTVSGMAVGPGGLLARNSAGGRQKANGRLSYRDIIFNNDGKLRPPYSAGPFASASAGYLFPRPADHIHR